MFPLSINFFEYFLQRLLWMFGEWLGGNTKYFLLEIYRLGAISILLLLGTYASMHSARVVWSSFSAWQLGSVFPPPTSFLRTGLAQLPAAS